MTVFSPAMTIMAQAAHRTARRLVRDFGEVEHLQTSPKGPAGFAATAQSQTSQTLRDELAASGYGFPDDPPAAPGKDNRRWIATSLDGALNFLHGIPTIAIAIALEEDGDIIAGVIYNPLTGELFQAERGIGAFLDGRRLRVSARHHLAESVLAAHPPDPQNPGLTRHIIQQATLTPKVSGLRQSGCPALDLAFLAAGRLDGFWGRGLSAQAVAAGIILVREAGGHVTDMTSRPDIPDILSGDHLIAANPPLHEHMYEALTSSHSPSRSPSRSP